MGPAIILFRYILRETVPQFISALIVSCSVLLISQLARLAEVLVNFGLSAENILLPILFVILPFLSFTIPWSFLFSVILAFGRLSQDGEYTAMLSAGHSLWRLARPVFLMAGVLYAFAGWSALTLEPWGRREFEKFLYQKAQTELDNMVKFKLQPGVFLNDFLGFTIYAEKMSKDRSVMENLLLAPAAGRTEFSFTLMAPRGGISGSVADGNLKLTLEDGAGYSTSAMSDTSTQVKFRSASIDLLRIFRDRILGAGYQDDDYRSYPPGKLVKYVKQLRDDPQRNDEKYWKASALLHQRLGSPFLVVIFAFFGLVLGVQDPRHGKNRAFLGGIFAIMVSYILVMSFKSLADQGTISGLAAAWIPNVILMSLGMFWLYQKNRLPLSESAFDPIYLPGWPGRKAKSWHEARIARKRTHISNPDNTDKQ